MERAVLKHLDAFFRYTRRPRCRELRCMVPHAGASDFRRATQLDASGSQPLPISPADRARLLLFPTHPSFPAPSAGPAFTSSPRSRSPGSWLPQTFHCNPAIARPCTVRTSASPSKLYTTGMRRGELLRLAVGDYDPSERTLLVRESVPQVGSLPLSCEGASELETYLEVHEPARLPSTQTVPLLWNHYTNGGRAYTGVGIWPGCQRPVTGRRHSHGPPGACLAFTTSGTHLPSTRCCGGTERARTYRRSLLPCSPPTWDTSPLSPQRTTFPSSSSRRTRQ